MRHVRGSARLFGLGGVLLFLGILGSSGLSLRLAAAADADVVARGRYLANMSCVECHSPRVAGDAWRLDQARLFSGGKEFAGPWGAVYARNITPDVATGIGSWTEAEIRRAIKDGISKDGNKLLVMPWNLFRGLADDDIAAIAAYLKTVPAVRNQVPAAKVISPSEVAGFIANVPSLKPLVPPALFSQPRGVFHDFVFGGDPFSSAPSLPGASPPQGRESVAAGQYLSQNMLGCHVCHTPNFAGGAPPMFAPNITPDRETGIGSWTTEQVERALKEGIRPDGRRFHPPVQPGDEAYGHGRLTDDDRSSLVAFLKSVPPVRRGVGEPNPDSFHFGPPAGPPTGVPSALSRSGGPAPPAGAAVLSGLLLLAAGIWLRGWRAAR